MRIAYLPKSIPMTMLAVAALALLISACTVLGESDVPDIERRAQRLNETIMCPVCPGESIDQSANPLAGQMRAIVDEKLNEGWTDRQIEEFFVERYGPSVLLQPPAQGFSLAAWVVPPVAFVLAIASLLLTLRWMRISAAAERGDGTEEHVGREDYLSRLEETLRPPSTHDTGVGDERRGGDDR
jgi:cytochrome c-type biogenesis protein CcmH